MFYIGDTVKFKAALLTGFKDFHNKPLQVADVVYPKCKCKFQEQHIIVQEIINKYRDSQTYCSNCGQYLGTMACKSTMFYLHERSLVNDMSLKERNMMI